eukprot:1152865-Pelagomonas_calceolata.AAC.2
MEFMARKEQNNPCRQREHSLHQSRKRRHVGSKTRESPIPEGKREASMGLESSWRHVAPGQDYNEYFCLET